MRVEYIPTLEGHTSSADRDAHPTATTEFVDVISDETVRKVGVRRLRETGVVPSVQLPRSLMQRARWLRRFEPSTSCALPGRPAHLLVRAHPAMQQPLHGAFGRRCRYWLRIETRPRVVDDQFRRPSHVRRKTAQEFNHLARGSVQKLVGSRGNCGNCIWTADRSKPLTEAGTKRPVVNCAADLQHQVSASPRPAHLLRLVHPAIDQEIRRALSHRSPDAHAGAVSSGVVDQPGALATEISVDLVKRMPQFSGRHASVSMTALTLVEMHDLADAIEGLLGMPFGAHFPQCLSVAQGSARWRWTAGWKEGAPLFNVDACLAVQAEPGSPPPHPAAAAQGHELARLRGRSRQRGSLTVWFTDETVAAWAAEPRTTRGGLPFYSPLAILTALTLRAEFHLAYRHVEGLIGWIISLRGLKLRVPDHTTFSRRSAALSVPQLPPDNTDVGNYAQPLHLLVDSTGLKLCGAGEWLVEKHGTRTRLSWRQLHLGVDADTGQILAAALTSKEVDDAVEVGPFARSGHGAVSSVTADGAYDQDGVYADVADRHPDAAVIVPPRCTAVLSDKAATAPTQRDCHL